MPNRSTLAILLLLSVLSTGLHAEDLGIIGPTYEGPAHETEKIVR
jgi:hypothetical protein